MGHFPKNFWSPLAAKLLVRLKYQGLKKWYGNPLSSCKVWWRSADAGRREKEKFVCIFFVSHAHDLELE